MWLEPNLRQCQGHGSEKSLCTVYAQIPSVFFCSKGQLFKLSDIDWK